MAVVSFNDLTPVPRFDGVPWTTILIDESQSETGPFIQIDSIAMSPVDDDPAHPIARSFSTDKATLTGGWYQVSWQDDALNTTPTAPTFKGGAPFPWIPSLVDVGSLLLSRTRDHNGVVLGTFTEETQPTADQVWILIMKSVDNVMPLIGTDIPDVLVEEAQDVVALRTAMYIELTYYANEVAQRRSAYPEFKALFDEKLGYLQKAVAAVEAGADPADSLVEIAGETEGYGYPMYGFPAAFPYMDPRVV